jgi:hypothetical protein
MTEHKKVAIEDFDDKIIKEFVDNPVFFCRVAFDTYFWSVQRKIALALKKYKRVSVYSCTGMGKSFLEANLLSWFLQTHPNSVVILVGSVFKQVKRSVWRVVIDLYGKSRIKLMGEPTAENWSITKGQWYAELLSGKKIEAMQGLHAPYLLFVMDEASGIPDFVYDAVMGNLSGGDSYVLMCGNPLNTENEFYKTLFNPRYVKFKVSVFDTPLFTGEINEIPDKYAKRLKKVLPTPEWVEEMRIKYGEDSLFWKTKILAEFPIENQMGMFNLFDIEYAFNNNEIKVNPDDDVFITVDVARYGEDFTVITIWKGFKMVDMIEVSKNSITEIAGYVENIDKDYQANHIIIDETGVGGGLVDILIENGYDNIYPVNFASKAFEDDKYANLGTEMFFNLREFLKNRQVKLIPDDKLKQELMAMEYTFDIKGRFKLVDMKKFKKKFGRSPDKAVATALRFVPMKSNVIELL